MLQLKLTGDEDIRIRCGVADFGVKDDLMEARTLMLDTDIVRIEGSGRIDLEQEKLDLDIAPKSKKASLVGPADPCAGFIGRSRNRSGQGQAGAARPWCGGAGRHQSGAGAGRSHRSEHRG